VKKFLNLGTVLGERGHKSILVSDILTLPNDLEYFCPICGYNFYILGRAIVGSKDGKEISIGSFTPEDIITCDELIIKDIIE